MLYMVSYTMYTMYTMYSMVYMVYMYSMVLHGVRHHVDHAYTVSYTHLSKFQSHIIPLNFAASCTKHLSYPVYPSIKVSS